MPIKNYAIKHIKYHVHAILTICNCMITALLWSPGNRFTYRMGRGGYVEPWGTLNYRPLQEKCERAL